MAQTIRDGLHDIGAISFDIQPWTPRGGRAVADMHVRGELAFGAIAQTGRAQASQNTYEHIITTNVCSVGTPCVTLIVTLD